ncbi:MAG: nonstructural protein [Microviridae sp.]|nr:MAG: nonstructural protein [Microviridae sp.]
MIQNVYAVFDHAAKAFLPPFLMRTDSQAQRAFAEVANSRGHAINEHPGDYNLFKIGTYDDSLGTVQNLEPAPFNLGSALLHLKPAAATAANQPTVPEDVQ